MKIDYSGIKVKTDTISEKLATILFLEKLTGLKCQNIVYSETLEGRGMKYSYVYVGLGEIGASCSNHATILFNYSDLSEIENKVRNFRRSIPVRLNDEYTAEVYKDKVVVGCQTFTIEQIKKILDVAVKYNVKDLDKPLKL